MTDSLKVEIYTDGACKGNPGPGGWGVLLRFGATEKELSGGEPLTTNNRMELMAAICGLEALTRPAQVTVFTDSKYVQQGISEWIEGWIARNWRTADKKPVKNADLWQRLHLVTKKHNVKFVWVKGHAGHPENERVDLLAQAEAENYA